MADLTELVTLLHAEEKLRAHGPTVFPNLLAEVWKRLKKIEEEHAPKKEEDHKPKVDLSKVDEGADKHEDKPKFEDRPMPPRSTPSQTIERRP